MITAKVAEETVPSPLSGKKYAVKVFFEVGVQFGPHDAVLLFHRWIQERVFENTIDVVNYAHVHQGPKVMLIRHNDYFAYDDRDGRPGLLYVQRRPHEGPFEDRLREALDTTLRAAQRLESEGVRFATGQLEFGIYDRLFAPNTFDSFARVEHRLRQQLSELFKDDGLSLEHASDPGRPFTVSIHGSQKESWRALG